MVFPGWQLRLKFMSCLLTGSPSMTRWWRQCWRPRRPQWISPRLLFPASLTGMVHLGYWEFLPPWQVSRDWPNCQVLLFLYYVDLSPTFSRLPSVAPKTALGVMSLVSINSYKYQTIGDILLNPIILWVV